MDEIAAFNRDRWNALVEAGVAYSQPWLDLTPEEALARLNGNAAPVLTRESVRGKQVLCLANGGGQQSVAFALLGADVTVFDLSDAQLAQDANAAAHHGANIRIEQGDMRDLSRFGDTSFDIVWQSYSINFIPDPHTVFAEVARVLRPGGNYLLQFSNPHRFSLRDEVWRDGYALTQRYRDGEAEFADDHWDVERDDGTTTRVRGPREFVHTWPTVINGLASRGFVIRQAREWLRDDPNAEVGSWAHFTQVLPPYITFWMSYRPDLIDATA
jgi:SAM-dependent methyltransferase